MKWSLIRHDLEGSGRSPKVLVKDVKQESVSKLAVLRRGSVWELRAGKNRFNFLVSSALRDGSRHVATHLGNFRVSQLRGDDNLSNELAPGQSKDVKSVMPGKVVRLLVKAGDTVQKDQAVLVLEAMKMENEIRTPLAGVITQIVVVPQQKVEAGQPLFKIEVQ